MIPESSKTVELSELAGLTPTQQIAMLQVRNKVARQLLSPDTAKSDIDESKNFTELSQDEAIAYKKKVRGVDHLEWYNFPSGDCFLNQPSNTYFEVDSSNTAVWDEELLKKFKEATGIDSYQFFLQVLSNVIPRYNKIRASFGGQLKPINSFFVEFGNQSNFSVSMMGGDRISVGIGFLHDLVKTYMSGDMEKLRTVKTGIESQFFHELTHVINAEDDVGSGTAEELTLLAEFLYDPLNNMERNASFAKYSGRVLEEDKLRAEGKWDERYDSGYKKVTSKILLKELHDRGVFMGSLTPDDIRNVLSNAHEYYAALPQEERDQVLAKYLPMKESELFVLGQRITQEMNLPY